MQQIIISGVGGQGVLTITRLLAEAALAEGRHVLISETHGMAQRGGNVISHLKVGSTCTENTVQNSSESDATAPFAFTSPLIRPGRADILLALHPDGAVAHAYFLKKDGKLFCSQPGGGRYSIDAAHIAGDLQSPVSANFVLLGFALGSGELFCPAAVVEKTLQCATGTKREINLKAFHAGLRVAGQKFSS